MEAIAVQKYIRLSPRKLRLIADMVRPMKPTDAVESLPFVHKRAAKPIEKVIRSAIANATMQGASAESLSFKEIQVSEGPRLKRGIAVSRGMWHPIVKRMSHVRVVVTNEGKPRSGKSQELRQQETVSLKKDEKIEAKDKPKKAVKRTRKEVKK